MDAVERWAAKALPYYAHRCWEDVFSETTDAPFFRSALCLALGWLEIDESDESSAWLRLTAAGERVLQTMMAVGDG